MYVSTLPSYLKTMGGELRIKAIFPDGEVVIEQFRSLGDPPPERLGRRYFSARDAAMPSAWTKPAEAPFAAPSAFL